MSSAANIEPAPDVDRHRPSRNFRCEDWLWNAARERAEQRGENLSEVLRRALHRYVEGG